MQITRETHDRQYRPTLGSESRKLFRMDTMGQSAVMPRLDVLRRPLLVGGVPGEVVTGGAILGVGIGSNASNPQTFATGVMAVLVLYGLMLIGFAWAASRGHGWALGLIVASSLLHALSVGSFLTSDDRGQFVLMLVVAPFVLATVVTSVLATGRREMDTL